MMVSGGTQAGDDGETSVDAPAGAHQPDLFRHVPVLLEAVLEGLQIRPGMRMVDATVGGGGHTEAMLQRSAPDGLVLGLDADPEAIQRVAERLFHAVQAGRLQLVQTNFTQLRQTVHAHHLAPVDAILLDLGVSSFQLDLADRGFSFQQDGPLDMRFDPAQPLSAADIVNTWPEQELADLLYQYGEERRSRRIARYLVRHRPFETTGQLARAVEQAVGGRRGERLHPATRTFQALRIAVNQELAALESVLPQCLAVLKPGGRLAVISFHSLEDRIVKRWMRAEASSFVQDPSHPQGGYEKAPELRIMTRKPIVPDVAEIQHNPRSRSAKLRIAERL